MPAYKTVSAAATFQLTEKHSKFMAFAFPVYSSDEIELHLKTLQKQHHKATHVCYAWRLGIDKNNFRANDNGEPAGTAGLPILNQIDSFGLSNVLLAVVRYFGGTKLGTSGLIAAYKLAAKSCLEQAKMIEAKIRETHFVTCEFATLADIMTVFKKHNIEILSEEFDENCRYCVSIDADVLPELLQTLKSINAKMEV